MHRTDRRARTAVAEESMNSRDRPRRGVGETDWQRRGAN